MAKPIPSVIPKDMEARFWAKVERRGPDDCWTWLGAITTRGYGALSIHKATHIALTLSGLPRPDKGAMALHSCDNPPCVNPNHLRWGTAFENAMDMVNRKRHQSTRKTHCKWGHELIGDNLFIRKTGHRTCRKCQRALQAVVNFKKREATRVARENRSV